MKKMLSFLFIAGLCAGIGVLAWPSRLEYPRSDKHFHAADTTDDAYKLPKNMIPSHYDLIMEPKMYDGIEENFTFSGHVGVFMQCKRSTARITLHSLKLDIDATTVKLIRMATKEEMIVSNIEYDTMHEFVHFTINENTKEGESYYLEMSFTGPLKTDYYGLYLSMHYMNTGEIDYEVATQMEPTYARKAFPCFDEPEYKAVFNISVIRKEGWIALSNGQKLGETNLDGDSVKDQFALTPIMSSYLVAIVVGKFKKVSTQLPKGVTFNVWAREKEINNTRLSLRVGSEVQTYFQDYLESVYPLSKQDMVPINYFAAWAMENWGLILYQPSYLLFNDSWTDSWFKKDVVSTVAHELAHQWFGNLVTLHWWSDTWLNEGFANFFQYIGTAYSFPEWDMRTKQITEGTIFILSRDNFPNYPPLHNPVSTPHEIGKMFGSISYEKGGAVINMMEHFVGEETFRKGLVNYMKKRQYSTAVPDDLLFALGNQTVSDGHPLDIKGIMDTWIYQNNYPVLMVTQNTNGDIHISQKRSSDGSNKTGNYPSPFGYIWKIPFTFTTNSERNFNKSHSDVIWIDQAESVIPSKSPKADSWIIGNIQGKGYYAVNYDESNWNSLIEQLRTDREAIHPINREKLVADASNLAYAGQLSQNISNKIYDAMNGENNAAVLRTVMSQFNHLDNMLSGTKAESEFKMFVQESIENEYSSYGYDSAPKTFMEQEKKQILVDAACKFGMSDCIQKAVSDYKDWMLDPTTKRISADVQKTVFCTAISEGGRKEWDAAFQQFTNTEDAFERMNLIEGMTCTKRSSILYGYLRFALDSYEITIEESSKLISAVSKNPVGKKMVLNFLKRHWNKIEQRFGRNNRLMEKLMMNLSGSFNTEKDLQEMTKIQSANTYSLGTTLQSLTLDEEMTEGNIRWMKNNYPVVADWLTDKQLKRR